ncbi:MAG: hypothetical protein CVV56_07950 [Tenericutes bacterium HGW-Tenericutes-1]|jgi:NADH:ubiquinone oxidoreductase subunit 6 (subunit J)|nr:MAG: hypothetical protein CVV56_07950 [Tenericutes bacterium HGW-Tenericutes-1]PKM95779.1 MAG: hypothetical protein CVU84_02980 [Firmicutes bacterium HGW-Firmicutes-1]
MDITRLKESVYRTCDKVLNKYYEKAKKFNQKQYLYSFYSTLVLFGSGFFYALIGVQINNEIYQNMIINAGVVNITLSIIIFSFSHFIRITINGVINTLTHFTNNLTSECVAIHEAGHVILTEFHFPFSIKSIKLTRGIFHCWDEYMNPGYIIQNINFMKWRYNFNALSKNDIEKQIAISLAGYINNQIYLLQDLDQIQRSIIDIIYFSDKSQLDSDFLFVRNQLPVISRYEDLEKIIESTYKILNRNIKSTNALVSVITKKKKVKHSKTIKILKTTISSEDLNLKKQYKKIYPKLLYLFVIFAEWMHVENTVDILRETVLTLRLNNY